MCKLCNENNEEARKQCVDFANKLEELAKYYRDLGEGKIYPHVRTTGESAAKLTEEIKTGLITGVL
jgi:hypothetical protein